MRTRRRLPLDRFRWTIPCIMGSLLFSACGADSDADLGLQTGIWMFTDVKRERDGKTMACRPMLAELTITDDSVVIGRRAFPCEFEKEEVETLTVARNGSSLLAGSEQIGTISGTRLDIVLRGGEREISWDSSRTDSPWRERERVGTKTTLYSAKLELRPDDTPVPIASEIAAEEEQTVQGWAHAATLPGTELTHILLYSPQHGILDIFDTSDGFFQLTPDPNYAGKDGLRFFVTKDVWHSPDVAVNITYHGTQDPPVCFGTSTFVSEDEPLVMVPQAYDPDDDPMTMTIVDPPAHGKAVVDGLEIIYTPDPNFEGVDSFSYSADDGTVKCPAAKVDLFVGAVDDPPVALDQDIQVKSGSAMSVTLRATDIDSTLFTYFIDSTPTLGQFVGEPPNLVYVPNAGVMQGQEKVFFHVSDFTFDSPQAALNITITPGGHATSILSDIPTSVVYPELTVDSRLYYRMQQLMAPLSVGMRDAGAAINVSLISPEMDTFGFDETATGSHRTIFFNIGSTAYFTTSTKNLGLRLYRNAGVSTATVFDIPAPGSDILSEPSVGNAYVEGSAAYLPIDWRNSTAQHNCQVWKTDVNTTQTDVAMSFPPANGPCFGIWSLANEQYMFVGSNLMKFSGMSSPPVVVKDLGDFVPTPWMVQAGNQLFFQTRKIVGSETQIDLWVTDGTSAGTQLIQTLEKAFSEFDIFSPVEMGGKLYFAHRKSLWTSDGTSAGTKIVATLPTSSVIGDGAIGKISVLNQKMFFLATTDAAGREPWVSDGSTVGTKMLRDIRVGTAGSFMASTNRTYFHGWNGQVFFLANDGANASGLWKTDGTTAGTKLFEARPMQTIAGILGNELVFHDGNYVFGMSLL